MWEHKNKVVPGFTTRYGVDRLVWYEVHEDREAPILREKRIKEWKRDWKIELIERENPHWLDLYRDFRQQVVTASGNGSRLSPGWNDT